MNNVEYYHLFFKIIIYYYSIYIIIYLVLTNDVIINFLKYSFLKLKKGYTNKNKLYDIRLTHKYRNILKIISLFLIILCIIYLLIKNLLNKLTKKQNCIIDETILNKINTIPDNKIIFNEQNNQSLYKKNIKNKSEYIEYLKKKCNNYNNCNDCIKSNLSLEDRINNLDDKLYYNCNFINNKKIYKYYKTLNSEQQPNCGVNENENNNENKSYLIVNFIFFIIILISLNFLLINTTIINKNSFIVKLTFFIILSIICISNLIYNLYKSGNFKDFLNWLPSILDLLLIIFLYFYDKYCLTIFVQKVLDILN